MEEEDEDEGGTARSDTETHESRKAQGDVNIGKPIEFQCVVHAETQRVDDVEKKPELTERQRGVLSETDGKYSDFSDGSSCTAVGEPEVELMTYDEQIYSKPKYFLFAIHCVVMHIDISDA